MYPELHGTKNLDTEYAQSSSVPTDTPNSLFFIHICINGILIHTMQKIKIKVICSQTFQLFFKHLPDVGIRTYVIFCFQIITVTGITIYHVILFDMRCFMELRILRYFLEVARRGNITRAAEHLHVSQPTLSRQLKDLEEELGKKLFVRSNYSVKLTDEGMLLRTRAEDILDMVDKTTDEFKALDEISGGDIRIGCAESDSMKYLIRAAKALQRKYPRIRYHIYSSGTDSVNERLDKGLLDFAVIVQEVDLSKYNYLEIPSVDSWGLLMRRDDPLAGQTSIGADDLLNLPIIISRQGVAEDFPKWLGEKQDKLNIVATYDLIFNASLMVKEGLGCALGFDKLIYTGADSELCFRPLEPELTTPMYVIWKKYQMFTPVAEKLLDELKGQFSKL